MRVGTIRSGQALRLVFAGPAVVHWGIDDWQQPQDTVTVLGMFGLQVADLASGALAAGQRLVFSIQDLTTGSWIEHDRVIVVVSEQAQVQGVPASAAASHIDRDAADRVTNGAGRRERPILVIPYAATESRT